MFIKHQHNQDESKTYIILFLLMLVDNTNYKNIHRAKIICKYCLNQSQKLLLLSSKNFS